MGQPKPPPPDPTVQAQVQTSFAQNVQQTQQTVQGLNRNLVRMFGAPVTPGGMSLAPSASSSFGLSLAGLGNG